MNDILTELIKLMVIFLAVILSQYIIPLLQSKLKIINLELVSRWALAFVQAAEATFTGSKQGAMKYDQVSVWLEQKLQRLGITMTQEEIRATIEQAVSIMKQNSETK